MLRLILASILVILGFLVITFFRKYTGTIIPYPFLIWFIGLGMFLGGLILLGKTRSIKQQKAENRSDKLIAELKASGEKMKVNLSQCEIKENNYVAEGKHGVRFPVNQSVLIFNRSHRGNTEKFVSEIIPFDRMTLLLKLEDQKETMLYIDKHDRTRYYIDLEFL